MRHESWGTSPRAARPARRDAAAAFTLFDLPDEAVELVLGAVDDLEDKRALRLVCKRTCASVDSRVVAVFSTSGNLLDNYGNPLDNYGNPLVKSGWLQDLVRAPWQFQTLDLSSKDGLMLEDEDMDIAFGDQLDDEDVQCLAAAAWPDLLELDLNFNCLIRPDLAAARWPALRKLELRHNMLDDQGAKLLAAGAWPALEVLDLWCNHLGDAGAASLAAGRWPALKKLDLTIGNFIGSEGRAFLEARWPTQDVVSIGDDQFP